MDQSFLDQLMYFRQPEREDYVSPNGGAEPKVIDAPKMVKTAERVRTKTKETGPKRRPMPMQEEMPPPEQGPSPYGQMMEEVLAEKRGSIEGVQKQLEAQQSGGRTIDGLNLQPLAAWLDSMNGTNTAGAYGGPTEAEKRAQIVDKLGSTLQRQKNEYADQALGFFKNKAYMDQVDAQRGNAQESREFDQWYKREMLKDKDLDRAAKEQEGVAGKELSQQTIKWLNEGKSIPGLLTDVRSVLDNNKEVFGPVEGFRRSLNPWDEQYRAMDSQVRMASQEFGKYMEGGVLRKEDEKKYRKMFPSGTDTPELAKNKLDIVERRLRKKHLDNIKAYNAQGYNTNGLALGAGMPGIPEVLGGGQGAPQIDPENLDDLTDEQLEAIVNGQ